MKKRTRNDNTIRDGIEQKGVVSASAKAVSAIGVVAAMALMAFINILAARHYQRWDCTTSKLYTLSPATLSTLRGLEQTVDIEVLLSPSDPLYRTVQNMLDVYCSKTGRIRARYVDPDRHPAEFIAIQQKYGIVAGRSEDGRVVTDAAIVMASHERHWFVVAEDLVDYGELEEGHSKSRLEQSFTGGIRAVVMGSRKHLCFTTGHGEYSIDDSSGQGLGELRDRLVKNNYDVETVNTTQFVQQNLPNQEQIVDQSRSISDCDAIVVVGPTVPFTTAESDAIAVRMRSGASGFFLLGPMLDAYTRTQLPTGLESVMRVFGINAASDYVFEADDTSRIARGAGEIFFPIVETHAVTEGLAGLSLAVNGMRIVAIRSRSFDTIDGEVHPAPILKTSDRAFGMVDFHGWAERGGDPVKQQGDRSGPLSIGLAAELPQRRNVGESTQETLSKTDESRTVSRLVVLGSANYALGQSFRDMALRGNANLTNNIISWIAAYQPIVDVPPKITPSATLRITESSLAEIARYAMIYMPAAALLLAVAVFIRRRSSDKRQARLSKQ